ncbi:MAG: hypothetical protein R3B82_02595 [Sandaracinaceae bacterium]
MRRCAWLLLGLASACGAATPPPEDPTDEDDGPVTYAIALRLEEAGPTDDETPQTRVALVRIAPDGERTLEELRVEQGACWAEAGQDPVLVTARCWWAGAGARYEVRREGDVVIARRQDLDDGRGRSLSQLGGSAGSISARRWDWLQPTAARAITARLALLQISMRTLGACSAPRRSGTWRGGAGRGGCAAASLGGEDDPARGP